MEKDGRLSSKLLFWFLSCCCCSTFVGDLFSVSVDGPHTHTETHTFCSSSASNVCSFLDFVFVLYSSWALCIILLSLIFVVFWFVVCVCLFIYWYTENWLLLTYVCTYVGMLRFYLSVCCCSQFLREFPLSFGCYFTIRLSLMFP